MLLYFQLLIFLPLLIVFYQFYAFSSQSKGLDKQNRCQKLGIAYMVIGILTLIKREPLFAFFGLVMIMFGFRLMAKGLDRIEKNVFIDRYDDDK